MKLSLENGIFGGLSNRYNIHNGTRKSKKSQTLP